MPRCPITSAWERRQIKILLVNLRQIFQRRGERGQALNATGSICFRCGGGTSDQRLSAEMDYFWRRTAGSGYSGVAVTQYSRRSLSGSICLYIANTGHTQTCPPSPHTRTPGVRKPECNGGIACIAKESATFCPENFSPPTTCKTAVLHSKTRSHLLLPAGQARKGSTASSSFPPTSAHTRSEPPLSSGWKRAI